jgi:hypothetical protein
VPWPPELFSAPALERILERRRADRLRSVPYFDGMFAGEIDALVGSFAGEPELHHPVRGRIKGEAAFRLFVADTNARLAVLHAEVQDVSVVLTHDRGIEEVVVHLDGDTGRIEVAMALAADHTDDGRLVELRIYFSTRLASGRHASRPPLLQADPDLRLPGIVAAYQHALAAGAVEGAVAAFEPDAVVREPAGAPYVHHGAHELRALYDGFFSNGGGIELEHCTFTDDGRACALEYNVVTWGRTPLRPEAGIAVYARGSSGKLAAARIYDDVDRPLLLKASNGGSP